MDVIDLFKVKVSDFANQVLSNFGFKKGEFLLVTLHRAENTDNPERLIAILEAFIPLSCSTY